MFNSYFSFKTDFFFELNFQLNSDHKTFYYFDYKAICFAVELCEIYYNRTYAHFPLPLVEPDHFIYWTIMTDSFYEKSLSTISICILLSTNLIHIRLLRIFVIWQNDGSISGPFFRSSFHSDLGRNAFLNSNSILIQLHVRIMVAMCVCVCLLGTLLVDDFLNNTRLYSVLLVITFFFIYRKLDSIIVAFFYKQFHSRLYKISDFLPSRQTWTRVQVQC